jgi:hypothetical protein
MYELHMINLVSSHQESPKVFTNPAVWEFSSPLLTTVSAHATKLITLITLSLLAPYQLSRWRGTDWIYLAHDDDQWRALVNTAMNFRVP